MMDYRYNGKIETDIDKNVLVPIVVLCTRSGRKIGVINNIQEFRCSHPLNDVSEISFDVYKEINGIKNIYWDYIKDFKFIFLPTVSDPKYKWYEITVNIDESNDTIKHITGIHANEAELGQLELYNIEINTENDIARDDYEIITIDGKEYGTVFYNPEHPKASLLHRLLSDKASHYSIIHVDETLKNIQREFSFNGTSIVDALKQTIAPEIGCLFVFGESNDVETNIFHRTISAYDLMDYCEDCGKRGTYSQGVCTNCGSHNIKNGYGKDTGIFINAENLTDSISFTSNTDQVKNFFKMGAGDEYMEAAIRNCNPNGSNYLFYFSDEMKEDMSEELVAKLAEYENTYDGYLKDYDIYLPAEDVDNYNTLVNKYQSYIKEDIPVMSNSVKGYTELTNYDYNAVNFKDCLQTTMMPSSPDISETTAEEQIAKLTVESMSPIGTEDPSALSLTASNTAVESYAKVYVDTSRYKIEIADSSYENNIWMGTIILTSLTDSEDTANKTLTILFNNDGAQFLKQKIQKMMEEHKVEDIGDVSFLQEKYTDEELESVFKPKLKKYSLDALSLLDDLCSATMDILADANQGTVDSPYYEEFYHPYWEKRKLIMEEESIREKEIQIVEQVIEDIDNIREGIINTLNMHDFFGDKLYSELMLYRRETEYSNSNFISDGLTDSEVIDRAQDYFKRAQEEIIKASTIQHSISCSLYNLFLLPEFRQILISDDNSQIQYVGEGLYVDGSGEIHNVGDNPQLINSTLKRFIDLFEGGNWLRIRVDDKIYKLRLTNWEIDYTKPEELDVEFSDVIYSGDTMSDIASLLSQARTMATSYNAVMRQAEKGNTANQTIEQQKKQGLILNQNKIINDVDTQNFVLNSQGALMRAKNDFDDGYSPEQIKLLNKGIYYTNDDWETVKAGLGHFIYYDPITKTAKEDYGIIASTIVGQLLLGENLKIFSESGKFEMGDDGLKITAIEGENNTDLFVVQKQKVDAQGRDYVEKYIYVDSDGNVSITGNSIIVENKPLIEYIDDVIEDVEVSVSLAEKTAINYMSSDSSGIMIADLRNGYYLPSNPDLVGQNVFIDSTEVNIRDGEDSLAVFGETTRIGDINGRNVTIDNNSVDIMSGNVSIASFAQNVRVGRETLPHMTINPTNISAYSGSENGNENLYFQVGDGSTTAYQTYNVDALPIELTLDNPIYDLTSVLINNQQVSDYSFYINETSVSIDDRPPEAITIVVNYQYEVTDYSESTDETTTQIVTTSQTFEYPKVDLNIPLEYPDIYIINVTPSTLDGTFSYDDNNIIFSPRPQSGTIINIEYYLNQSARQPYFTFNGRNSNGEVGSGSISFANNGVASGESSFVTGIDSSTTGKASFSSGEYNNSSGEAGSTMGKNLNNNAIGGMAIGTYNVQSPNSIFTVGNGTSDLDRRNALTVASNGNSIFAGRLFSGTHANDAKPMFKVETFNFTSIGIGSGRGYGAERKINRNGYIPIAIAGFQILDNQPNGKYSLWCVPTRVYIDFVSNNYVLRFYIWNQHSSEMAIVRFVARVLYIASSVL